MVYWSMASSKKTGFAHRGLDHITDELVRVLGSKKVFEFKDLFLMVYAGLKLKSAASGGEEMLRLRCHEKLRYLVSRGLVLKTGKRYKGLKGLDQALSVHRVAKVDAAIKARLAAAG